jgi:hypothetical protein
MLVNTRPSSPEVRCSFFSATIGSKAGIAEMQIANRKLRARKTWTPDVYTGKQSEQKKGK